MKIAVIGAAGFVGCRLVETLLSSGIEVLPYDLPPSLVVGGMPTACVDLRTVPTLAFPSGTDAVVYLAQSPQYKNQSNGASELLAVNMLGAVKACEAAVGAGAKLFLYASSGSVAWRSFQPLDESCPTRRDDFYALSKLGAEDALKLFSDRISVCSARLFGVYGPNRGKLLASDLMDRVESGTPIVLHPAPGEGSGSGGLKVSFLYIDDLCESLLSLVKSCLGGGVNPPELVNIAGERALSLKEFASAYGSLAGTAPLFELSSEPRTFDLVADISLLKRVLNPAFTPLETALARIAAVRKGGLCGANGAVRR